MIVLLSFISLFILAACGNDEIPNDAAVAVCLQGDTFKYVYKDDVVYEFYSNDVLQSNDMRAIVQDAVDSADDVETYLDTTFQEGYVFFQVTHPKKNKYGFL